jgi:anion-transporting  ArsA/GET3 family ATPase
VGKTTLSAAMAVLGALNGKRTAVITIDPAKRLATSLGLDELGDHPTDITERLRDATRKLRPELAGFTGTLEAIVPDTKRTFEEFVRSLSSSPAVAERVIQNPIFQIFAKEFSGTNEYMAMEKLFSIAKSGRYDCIVLDTPPSRNTLAFLDVPALMARLFEEKLIRWVAVPANKFMAVGMKKALSLLERLTGQGFMVHMVEFFAALLEVQGSFSANLKEVMALLESDRTGFLMVAAPSTETAPDARAFIEALQAHRLHFDGILINRTLGYLQDEPGTGPAFDLVRALQRRERGIVSEICGSQTALCAQLPELARDVHSVEDLLHVAMAFGA